MINNKKGMSISIVLLVVLTLILVFLTIGYFIVNQEERTSILSVPDTLDLVYNQETYLNFYLQNIFDKASGNFKFPEGKGVFIERFKNELLNLKINGLENIENQINESNIDLTKDKLVLNLNLVLEEKNEERGIEARYNYKKSFEKVFKG